VRPLWSQGSGYVHHLATAAAMIRRVVQASLTVALFLLFALVLVSL
jgi:hypothetical protein